MRITFTYNPFEEGDEVEKQAELLDEEYVREVTEGLKSLGHEVTPLSVSKKTDTLVDELIDSHPELIFNLAEGVEGSAREARYPAIFESLGYPYTGANAAMLLISQDKRLCGKIFESRGVRTPRGVVLTPDAPQPPETINYPAMIKPNYEGSSKGIFQDSVVSDRDQARETIAHRLEHYPEGVVIEEFIAGRELTVPFLEAFPDTMLEIAEWRFSHGEHNIHDFEVKDNEQADERVERVVPAPLDADTRREVLGLADHAYSVLPSPDFGRVDLRLDEDNVPWLIELNPLTCIRRVSTMTESAATRDLSYEDVLEHMLRSACSRYNLAL